ncbi:MAG: hypothetical protein R3C43_19255 [Chloroflexota bacterium]
MDVTSWLERFYAAIPDELVALAMAAAFISLLVRHQGLRRGYLVSRPRALLTLIVAVAGLTLFYMALLFPGRAAADDGAGRGGAVPADRAGVRVRPLELRLSHAGRAGLAGAEIDGIMASDRPGGHGGGGAGGNSWGGAGLSRSVQLATTVADDSADGPRGSEDSHAAAGGGDVAGRI